MRVRSSDLSNLLNRIFAGIGLKEEHSDAVVRHLVSASLRGTDTHGIALAERYVEGIRAGKINTRPEIRVLKDNPSTVLIDGDFGAGQYVATKATKMAIQRATKNGIGAVSAINISHCGMLAYYGILMAETRMAGIVFTNSNALAAPWGGSRRVFGTNPICLSFPYDKHPIVFDAATTMAAGMKVVMAAKEGRKIPRGWAVDRRGRPTSEPEEALGGALLPFGEHKGYGLMLMVELYASVLAGGDLSYEISKRRDAQGGFYVQAIDIRRIRDYRDYLKDVRRLASRIKSSRLAGQEQEVYLPGEPEFLTARRRLREGIPVDEGTWNYLSRLCNQLRLRLPNPV